MPIVTEVRFAHENGALADTLDRRPELSVSVIQETSTNPERNLYFMRFEESGAADVRETLEVDATVSQVEPMPGFEDQPVWGVEFAPETKLMAPTVTNEDGFVLEARSTARVAEGRPGWHEQWLLPHRAALQDIWQWAHEARFAFDVLTFRQGTADPESAVSTELTDVQREALVAAYEQGYFADPRETSLEELAASLDRSPTAVADRIRRAMKATIERTLVTEYPE